MARPSNTVRASAEAKKKGFDPFSYMVARGKAYANAKDYANAERVAMELMPYVKPKLRTVDMKMDATVTTKIKIGGGA